MFLLYFILYYSIGIVLTMALCGLQTAWCALKKTNYDAVFEWQTAMVGWMVFKLIGEKAFNKFDSVAKWWISDEKRQITWGFISVLWWPLQVVLLLVTFPVGLYAVKKEGAL